jgi:aspartyl aminopeptidase
MSDVLDRFLAFLDAAPTPHHAVAEAARQLGDAGFTEVRATEVDWPTAAGSRLMLRQDGTLFAVRLGSAPLGISSGGPTPGRGGFRVIAAHTDSPNLRIKPQPLLRSHGYVRVGVEVYGGAQVATWVDRDLGIAGAVHVRADGGAQTRLVHIRRPVARVPTLAIHLNRGVNDEGLKLNAQTQLPAVLSLDGEGDPLRALLAEAVGCEEGDLLTWDLSLFDLTPAARGGAHGEFVFSGRLDNLGSSHAALEAMLASADDAAEPTAVIALFDHEEIGSRTSRGADSRAIETVLRRLCGGDVELDVALARSTLLSADMAHAVHPAFADKSEPEHAPRMNGGPAIKLNTNARYTTEGTSAAMFALLCERAEVPHQWFVSRTDLACGSTVGPMLASRLGVRALDVGNPMLSMHSAREQAGALDHPMMVKVMSRFLVDPQVG